MRKRLLLSTCSSIFCLAALLCLGAMPAAGKASKPAKVAIGKPAIGTSVGDLASILVPVHYPIHLAGRIVETRVALLAVNGKPIRSWVLHERLNSGRDRLPERRRRFTFVHKVGLRAGLSRRLRAGARVRVIARGDLDVDEDGRPELRSGDLSTSAPSASPRRKPVCSSIPQLRVKRGARVSLPLPACDRAIGWKVTGKKARGSARVRGERLVYRAPRQFRGTTQIQLAAKGVRQYARVTVGATGGLVVRALGDSVTAGFGYTWNEEKAKWEEMPWWDLLDCRPKAKRFNDACSSNSLSDTSEEGPVTYAPEYGLSNKISWAAQWANGWGVTNYRNFAISGSEPKNWAPEGEFHFLTEKIKGEEPDYILLTLGANPLLSNILFGLYEMGCARFGSFRECVEEEFAAVELRKQLRRVYTDLLAAPKPTIFVMQYHLAVPAIDLAYSSVQIAEMGNMLNEEIRQAATETGSNRIKLVTPPHFNVGVNLEGAYPSKFTCRVGGEAVDGASVQSNKSQWEFEHDPFGGEFCPGPANAPRWVIDGDFGIHPSATGYKQMAGKVPAPSP